MQPSALWPILIPIAYVLGSIPFGLIIGRANGIDPRTAGSGNIGATNVGRLLGKKFFVQVFLLDMLKGFIPMLVASALLNTIPESNRHWWDFTMALSVGALAVLGHMFSVFIKFKGGKGVATSLGVVVGLIPYYTVAGLAAFGVFIIVFKATRFVSLGSIIAVISFPIIYLSIGLWRRWPVFGAQLPLLIFSGLIVVMIVVRHRANISRLIAGTENRIAPSKSSEPLEASQSNDAR